METMFLILHRKPMGEWKAKAHVYSSKNLAEAMIEMGMPNVKDENKAIVPIAAPARGGKE